MTRKSHKGIVGKAMPTVSRRYKVGPGIDFVDENLTRGSEINKAIHKETKSRDL
ncbi:hypothetical protein [Fonticella tunisiensis]|uniref:Uncharacterized protein n=1 Tax=Fonticella tunisiensis TaxID=1096341 RepID=A0A4R7KPV2_9CLOT|nr:hypothetical protein [Fonticella tunisiensis]TDT61169.1 hypothetical protein EDD71_10867 [Fonticella tunisiensis]